jgi:hypothetical protein
VNRLVFSLLVLLAGLFFTGSITCGQDPTFQITSPDQTLSAGLSPVTFSATFSIGQTNTPTSSTSGFTFSFEHDPLVLQVVDPYFIDRTAASPFQGDLAALNAGTGPDFVSAEILVNGFTFGVIYDFTLQQSITFEAVKPVIEVDYSTNGVLSNLPFTTTVIPAELGSPPLATVVAIPPGVTAPTIALPFEITFTPTEDCNNLVDDDQDTLIDCADPDCAAETDTDGDGLCDGGDPDDDNDLVPDNLDSNPLDAFLCRDDDLDGCDDCSSGVDNPAGDGADLDSDGLCDFGDPDDDNDGVLDVDDLDPSDPTICEDVDADGCDDCSIGLDGFGPLSDNDPLNDGTDTDNDGLCDPEVAQKTFQISSPDQFISLGVPLVSFNVVFSIQQLTGTVHPTAGFQFSYQHDPSVIAVTAPYFLDLTNSTPSVGELAACNNGLGPDFFATTMFPDGFTLGVIYDTNLLDVIVCEVNQPMLEVEYSTVGAFLNLPFSTTILPATLGTPPVQPVVTLTGGLSASTTGLPVVITFTDQEDCNNGLDDDLDTLIDCNDPDCSAELDTDGDGQCDTGDTDDDNDGVADGLDSAPLDNTQCRDVDGDGCDDCSSGTDNPAADGIDTDSDGQCDSGDTDDDNDGVEDGDDSAPLDNTQCRDADGDGCDDCSSGTDNPAGDGTDFDGDGLCDSGDPDDDNDGALDADDSDDNNANVCSDTDGDGCEDCSGGSYNPAADGTDFDGDGLCDSGDPDDDNDGALDTADSDDNNANVCSDTDGDGCDDCSGGSYNPAADGTDFDSDGLCDSGDLDDDNDGALDTADSDDNNANVCSDTDGDGCDDCSSGSYNPAADGTDFDGDGLCDTGDSDDDNDGVTDGDDSAPLDNTQCRDADGDGCDDCSSGTDDPAADGTDTDGDGLCDIGDPDDDGDGIDDVCDIDSTGGADCDGDGQDDSCETDTDMDGSIDDCDADDDGDGIDDVCDIDSTLGADCDLNGEDDSCQVDTDLDGIIDPCDPDIDDDGILNGCDIDQTAGADCDNDGQEDSCQNDSDGDGVIDVCDSDLDGDGIPDVCDVDQTVGGDCDQDGQLDVCQLDTDNDGLIDNCDPDIDGDGFLNECDADDHNDGVVEGIDCDGNGQEDVCQLDTDLDGSIDECDPDDDNDGSLDTADSDDTNPNVCSDTDGDGCDDCSGGSYNTAADGTDTDGDGVCDLTDLDIDGDGVPNAGDSDDFNANICSDDDADGCDDCSGGSYNPAADGTDTDSDGVCDLTDSDIDGDGALNAADSDDFNANVCSDTDGDGCDDCTNGNYNVENDGIDTDGDGVCDQTDPDIDGDGALNASDSDDFNANVCSDTDGDGCDDCSGGSYNPAADGVDFDGDGLCDGGDPDDDGDGALDAVDSDDHNPTACSDIDGDGCDDCSGGTFDLAADGLDTDGDGLCDSGDTDDDDDGVPDFLDAAPLNNLVCRDVDLDGCDDCSSGIDDVEADGTDTDGDGVCDLSDSNINNPFICSDTDFDGCDDCSSGAYNPNNDGCTGDNDCNNNGIPDDVELQDPASDCNLNGIVDECDLAQGVATDMNNNGIPDTCECEFAQDLVCTRLPGSSTIDLFWGEFATGVSVIRDGVEIALLTGGETGYSDLVAPCSCGINYQILKVCSNGQTATSSTAYSWNEPHPDWSFNFNAEPADDNVTLIQGGVPTSIELEVSIEGVVDPQSHCGAAATHGFTMAMSHDSSQVSILGLELAGAMLVASPDYVSFAMENTGSANASGHVGWSLGILYSFDPFGGANGSLDTVSFETNEPVARAIYQANCQDWPDPGVFQLDFQFEGLWLEADAELIDNVVVVCGVGYPVESDATIPSASVILNVGEPLPIFIRGDCSNDGDIDIQDAVLLLNLMFSGVAVDCLDASDVNDDGVINLVDPVYELLFIMGLGPVPPAPSWPSCGGDSTPDGGGGDLGCDTPPTTCTQGCPVSP